MKSHDSWLLEGSDAGLDDARMPCGADVKKRYTCDTCPLGQYHIRITQCGVPYEDHNDRALGHKFEPIHEEEGYDGNFNEEV